jgi:hypothetical protein
MMNDKKEMTLPLLGYSSYKNFISWIQPAEDDLLRLTIPVFIVMAQKIMEGLAMISCLSNFTWRRNLISH